MQGQQRYSDQKTQERPKVAWVDKIIIDLQEHLYIVEKGDRKVIKCDCGYEFGDYKMNWKYNALVYDRNPREIYPGKGGHDPDWCTYREFYCPGCLAQLEVEAVPHGMPFLCPVELDLG